MFYRFNRFEYQLLEDYLNEKAALGYELKSASRLTFKPSDTLFYYFVNPKELINYDEAIGEVGRHRDLYIYKSRKPILLEHSPIKHPKRQILFSILLLIGLGAFLYLLDPHGNVFNYLLILLGLNDDLHHFFTQYSYLLAAIGIILFFLSKLIDGIGDSINLMKTAIDRYSGSITVVAFRSILSTLFILASFVFFVLAFIDNNTSGKTTVLNTRDDPIITEAMLSEEASYEEVNAVVTSTPFCKLYIDYAASEEYGYEYRYYEMYDTELASMIYRSLLKDLLGDDDPTYNSDETTRLYQFGNILHIYQKENYVFYFFVNEKITNEQIQDLAEIAISHS